MNRSIRNYDKLVQLYGQDKATEEYAKIASEIRQRLAATGTNDFMDTIDGIDYMVSQNEVILESFEVFHSSTPNMDSFRVQYESGSSSKKAKTSSKMSQYSGKSSSKYDEGCELVIKGLDTIAQTITKSTNYQVKCHKPLPILEHEVWEKLNELNMDPIYTCLAYHHLLSHVSNLRCFLGCLVEEHRDLLFDMISNE